MATDRSVRYLTALRGASTARVLNLAAIAERRSEEEGYRTHPFFESPVINRSMLLKHRVRADEAYSIPANKSVTTKLIVPFDHNDLKLGGRSLLYDQRGFKEAMQELGNYFQGRNLERDCEVLKLINDLPSLDPFLLREHLKDNGITISECYFEISEGDRESMYEFVARDIRGLIKLATRSTASMNDAATARLVTALLSSEVDEKLGPLRATLKLEGAAFREGVFSWRGFLYYKWCALGLKGQLASVLNDIKSARVSVGTPEQHAYLTEAKVRLIRQIHASTIAATKVLAIYDEAYAELTEHGKPSAFRDFLLSAPYMFLDLGEKMGAISHITSFWRYRFPEGTKGVLVDIDEMVAIFQDFEAGFRHGTSGGEAAGADAA